MSIVINKGDFMGERKYYVYEWIRLDTNEPFYVGKGCGNRAYQIDKSRNAGFNNVVQNIDCAVVILLDNLSEKEAYQYEVWFINEYRYIYGFGLVNMDDGGLGAVSGKPNYMYGRKGELHPNYGKSLSNETRKKMSIVRKGVKNPMFGRRGEKSPLYGRKASKERKLKISKALKGKSKSKTHIENLKESLKNRDFSGKNNPNYGNGEKITGLKNPSALEVKVINNKNEIEFVGCKKDVCKKYGISEYLITKLKNRQINVDKDFTRNKKKYEHINGYEFKM
jgi:hypothetical protein